MMPDSRHDVGRGRDLAVMTLEIVAHDGHSRTFSSVLCPKEQRARPIDECSPCIDSGGPAKDPTAKPGFLECRGRDALSTTMPREAADPEPSVADRTAAWKVMTRAVVAIRADLPVESARALLVERGIGGAPVVDGEGHPIGMLSERDIVQALPRALRGLRVADVMSRRASTVPESAPVSEAATLMASEGLHRLAVVSRDGRVVGVLTPLDVIRWLAAQDGLLLPGGRTLQAG